MLHLWHILHHIPQYRPGGHMSPVTPSVGLGLDAWTLQKYPAVHGAVTFDKPVCGK